MDKIGRKVLGIIIALGSAVGVLSAPLYATESDANILKGEETTIISEEPTPITDWVTEEDDPVIIAEENTTTTNKEIGGDANEAPTIEEPVVSPLESSVMNTASITEIIEYTEESTICTKEESVEIASEKTSSGTAEDVFEEDVVEIEDIGKPIDIEFNEGLLGEPIDAIIDEELSEVDDIEGFTKDIDSVEAIDIGETLDIVENTEDEIKDIEESGVIEEIEEVEAPNYEEYGYFFAGGVYDVNKIDVFIITPSDLGTLSPDDVNLYIYITSIREDLEACYITDLEGNSRPAYSENFIAAAEYAEKMLGGRKTGKSTVENWIFEGTIADDGATYEEYVARFEELMI